MAKVLLKVKAIGSRSDQIVDPFWSFEDIHRGMSLANFIPSFKFLNLTRLFPSFSNFAKFLSLALVIVILGGLGGLQIYVKIKEGRTMKDLVSRVEADGVIVDETPSANIPVISDVKTPTSSSTSTSGSASKKITQAKKQDRIILPINSEALSQKNVPIPADYEYFTWADKSSSYQKGKRYYITWE